MTNQSLVGEVLADLSGETLMEVRFSDYAGQQILPTQITAKSVEPEVNYTITEENSSVIFGKRQRGEEESNFTAQWRIEGNRMIVMEPESTLQSVITSIARFQLTSLTTSEKSYTKFIYRAN